MSLFVALQALGADWASWGYDVAEEPFLCAPHAFLGAIPLAVLLWLRALRYYDARPWAAFVSCALGAGLFVLEVVMYREALEVLGIFPVSQGTPLCAADCSFGGSRALTSRPAGVNVVARLAPMDGRAATQRLIVTAHQDRCAAAPPLLGHGKSFCFANASFALPAPKPVSFSYQRL